MDLIFAKIVEAVQLHLKKEESIVSVTLAQPLSVSHADYLLRYKVRVGKVNVNVTAVAEVRCIVVQFSSNKNTVSIDNSTKCETIKDML